MSGPRRAMRRATGTWPGTSDAAVNAGIAITAVTVVSLATAIIGFYGLRISRTTGDFYVASRTVTPWWNASAIGGEYLSAASVLGIAGLVLLQGEAALWYPVGYTAGYLMLLLFVAAPLRRSGAYTIPDFTEARLESRAVRRVTSLVVVMVGWLYIVPQLHGAALTIHIATGLPNWVGSLAVVVVVCLTVVAGGMRSITFVQAFQYWLKLTALAVPILFIIFVLAGQGAEPESAPAVNPTGAAPAGLYQNVSLLVALLFGTLGLPHVLVRFYTNPDGHSARRTTLIVLGLLSVFYLFPTAFGLVARMFAPDLARSGQPDAMVLRLPGELIGGVAGDLLSALVVAGAFAAFLSTISAVVPLGFAFMTGSLALAGSVGLVFAFTASTVCPVLLLGIWWRGLTDAGAIAGMVTGGVLCGGAMIAGSVLGAAQTPSWLAQPAAWTVPAAFAVTILVSRATRGRVPRTMTRVMTRLHTPERPLATER